MTAEFAPARLLASARTLAAERGLGPARAPLEAWAEAWLSGASTGTSTGEPVPAPQVLLEALADASEARAAAADVFRAQASVQLVRQPLAGERQATECVRALFVVPVFAALPESSAARVAHSAYEAARSLEHTFGLPAHALTLAPVLLSASRFALLDVAAWRPWADALALGQHPEPETLVRIASGVLGAHVPEVHAAHKVPAGQRAAWLWPMSCTVPAIRWGQTTGALSRLGAHAPEVAQYRHRTEALLERELGPEGLEGACLVRPPVLAVHGLAASQGFALNLAVRALEIRAEAVAPQDCVLRASEAQGTLELVLAQAQGGVLETQRWPVDALGPEATRRVLEGSCKRLALELSGAAPR